MLTLYEFTEQLSWCEGNPAVYPPDEVYWITFGGQAFTGLTRDQWSALYIVADRALGYKAIMWGNAPKDYPSDHFYNVPTHAEVKSNA